MKTLLIVEDETLIRQGIRAIVERSGLPVDEVLECKNGREALDLLEIRPVDVMIADLRMPVMNGLALVHETQKIDNPPLVVVISGFDEFSYAVDMLREGVRDYLLKPLDREKLVEVLSTLDRELTSRRAQRHNRIVTGRHLLRALMLGTEPASAELSAIQEQLRDILVADRYIAVCLPPSAALPGVLSGAVSLPNMNGHLILLDNEHCLDALAESEYGALCAGISRPHSGVDSLRTAFIEAEEARGAAFLQGMSVRFQAGESRRPAAEEPPELTQIIHLFGAGGLTAVKQALGQILMLAQNGRMSPVQFVRSMEELVAGLNRAYPGAFSAEEVERLSFVLSGGSAYYYYLSLCDTLEEAARRMQGSCENKNKRRISQAILYLKENFRSDVDMAQVSNHVSMNYAQFSYLFKQYTGSNFLEHLKALRLEESMRLLREGDLRIKEVSRLAGFKNEKHFMKVFKQAVGVSPGEYRKAEQMKGR